MRSVALALALALIAPAAAAAQDPAPSLAVDTVFSLPGVDTFDFRPDLSIDDAHGAAVDPALGRFYAVGRTETTSGDTNIAVVARTANGSLDPSFGDDGRLSIPVTPGRDDYAVSLAVLPDHRLRVLGATDVSPAAGHDLALVGLLANGTPDPTSGATASPASRSAPTTRRPPSPSVPTAGWRSPAAPPTPWARLRSSPSATPTAGPPGSRRWGSSRPWRGRPTVACRSPGARTARSP